jgi:5-methylcytosine-specific restriction endonuclease McrA
MRNASVDLTEEEKKCITDMYLKCPKGYEVDHIIPISKGGKHHPDNLQYLTVTENRKKYNKCLE